LKRQGSWGSTSGRKTDPASLSSPLHPEPLKTEGSGRVAYMDIFIDGIYVCRSFGMFLRSGGANFRLKPHLPTYDRGPVEILTNLYLFL
jgi:hypothetical protein